VNHGSAQAFPLLYRYYDKRLTRNLCHRIPAATNRKSEITFYAV